MQRSACHDVDPALLFPVPGDTIAESSVKRRCAVCPIRFECLEVALETQQLQGIWGGLTADERTRLLDSRRVRSTES
jgi:WhiB family redox-sensing transcriptional regulator